MALSNPCHIEEDLHHLADARKVAMTDAFSCYLPAEIKRAQVYAEKYLFLDEGAKCPPCDLVCHIGDNPAGTKKSTGWCTWSCKSGRLPTIRRSSGLYIAIFHNRHLLLKEMYLSMGYPSYPLAAQSAGVAQYETFVPGLTYFDSLRALGNSMHVAQVGVAMGCLLLCSTTKP